MCGSLDISSNEGKTVELSRLNWHPYRLQPVLSILVRPLATMSDQNMHREHGTRESNLSKTRVHEHIVQLAASLIVGVK
jgi:hypothetical protein